MSFARALMASSYPYVLQAPEPLAGGAAPPAPAPPAAPVPAAAPPAQPAAAPAGGAPAPTLAAGGEPPAPAPAAPPGPAAPPVTIAAGGGTPPPVAVPANWPDDWRTKIAGDDKAAHKTLESIADPAALYKSYNELRAKVSSGELKAAPKAPPADATPEQVAAWRAEQNLPANAEAFVAGLKLPGGVVPGEADKPLLANFAEAALKNNWTGDQYAQAVGWYFGRQDQIVADRQRADSDFMQEATIELTKEWGNNFKANQTAVTALWDAHFPKAFTDQMLNARMPDGTVLGNHPMFSKASLELSKVVNPAATLLPNVPGANMSSVDGRVNEIHALMRAPIGTPEWKSYYQNEKVQEEYRGLVTAQQTMKERGRAA
jgi:hypothetical protein